MNRTDTGRRTNASNNGPNRQQVGRNRVCGSKNCKTCSIFDQSTTCKSSYTGREYSLGPNLHCGVENVVYLVTCKKCKIQYVGETENSLRQRMCGHRSCIKNLSSLLGGHFDDHGIENFSVQIIERIDPRRKRHDKTIKDHRLDREDYWMRELGTITPFGLNEKVRRVGNISQKNVPVTQLFHVSQRRPGGHGRRTNRANNKCGYEHVTVTFIQNIWQGENRLHNLRTTLFGIPLPILHKLVEAAKVDPKRGDFDFESMFSVVHSISQQRLYKPVKAEGQPPVDRKFMKIKFANKGIDYLNISNILRNKKVQKQIPPYFKDMEPPTISYTYPKPIATKIFNFNEVAKNFDSSSFNANVPNCDCASSAFVYEPYNHIITGDLEIIPHEGLRDLVRRGPKFREQGPINWGYCKKILLDALEDYAKRWSNKEDKPCYTLEPWLTTIKEIIDSKIKNLSRKSMPFKRPILNDEDVKSCLAALHDKYVMVPADKAANNVIVICKWYYCKVLFDEFGLANNAGNATYQITQLSEPDIVSELAEGLHSLRLPANSMHFNLPVMYWTPKLHKNPCKYRFIASGKKFILKETCQLFTKVLQEVQSFWQRYCMAIERNSGVKCFWILKDSIELLKWLKNPDKLIHLDNVETYDFSTLYTSFPHSVLIDSLIELVTFAFRKSSVSHMSVFYNYAKFGGKGGKTVTLDQITNGLKFLFENIYVRCGNTILKQIVGFPMGYDHGPLCANLSLFFFEYKFLCKLMKNKQTPIARKFAGNRRFIDDLFSANNPYFDRYKAEIYPEELILKLESTPSVASYLDLKFEKINNTYKISLYDKRDDFSFEIVNYPWLDSNIPSSPAYGVYISRLLAFGRACDDYTDFSVRHRVLVDRLIKQGYVKSRLKSKFIQFFEKYKNLISKYDKTCDFLMEDGFSHET